MSWLLNARKYLYRGPVVARGKRISPGTTVACFPISIPQQVVLVGPSSPTWYCPVSSAGASIYHFSSLNFQNHFPSNVSILKAHNYLPGSLRLLSSQLLPLLRRITLARPRVNLRYLSFERCVHESCARERRFLLKLRRNDSC
jgi:hypothetical protein